MADLSALKAVVADLKDNVVAKVVAALQSTGVPQAEIDALTADVQVSVDALNAAVPQ